MKKNYTKEQLTRAIGDLLFLSTYGDDSDEQSLKIAVEVLKEKLEEVKREEN